MKRIYIAVLTVAVALAAFASPASAKVTFVRPAAAVTAVPTYYVHGIIASGGCAGQSGKQAATIASVVGPLTGIDYYCGDHDGASIRNAGAGPCDSLDPTHVPPAYNANTPIERIACDLAWYLANTYGATPVNLIGHSMGGLIIRSALYYSGRSSSFPASIAVAHAVTISTPHNGIDKNTSTWTNPLLGCGTYTECEEMLPNSPLLTDLATAPSPGGAAWTLIGGSTKDIMTAASSCGMTGSVRIDYYLATYSHTGYLSDLGLAKDQHVYVTTAAEVSGPLTWYRPLAATREAIAA